MPEVPAINERDFYPEFTFNATKSSGPGGQHVNKVSTRIELRFDVEASLILTDEEKKIILNRLVGRINKDGILSIVSQTERTQTGNRRKVIERFYKIIGMALAPVKSRKPTQPTIASRLKRLETKHLRSERKVRRRPAFEE
jgi:ribosome-associated protein